MATQINELEKQPAQRSTAGKRMLQGAGIALILISLFLLGAGEPNPEWPKFWMLKPLLVVTTAGALGGLFVYNMDPLRSLGGWRKILAILISLLVYLVVLWLSAALGLNGTMWD